MQRHNPLHVIILYSMSTFGDRNSSELSHEDYYIILGVDFKASHETIVATYRQLARKYHPDKHHQNEAKRREAEIVFNRIKSAYDVLSDPHKRAIYDTVGPEGLKLDGWKLVTKQITAQDIRDDYQRLVQNKLDSQMINIAKPRGIFTVSLDASDLFAKRHRHLYHNDTDADEDDDEATRMLTIPNIEISSMSASMSVEHTVETNHAIRLNGSIDTKNGTGGGSIGTNYRYTFSPASYVEVVYQIGRGPIFTVRGHRKLNSKTSLTGSWFFYKTTNDFAQGFRVTLSHNIRENVIGKLNYKEGVSSSITTSLIYINARLAFNLVTSFKLSTDDRNSISVDLGYDSKTRSSKMSVSLALVSEDGLEVEYGIQTRVSDISVIGAALAFSIPSGVTLKIRYNRANQEFNFPIYLADERTVAPIFYGTVIPIITYQLFQRNYLNASKKSE